MQRTQGRRRDAYPMDAHFGHPWITYSKVVYFTSHRDHGCSIWRDRHPRCRRRHSMQNALQAACRRPGRSDVSQTVGNPAGLALSLIGSRGARCLPSNPNTRSAFSTMHCTSRVFAALFQAAPWHQWPTFASVTGVSLVPLMAKIFIQAMVVVERPVRERSRRGGGPGQSPATAASGRTAARSFLSRSESRKARSIDCSALSRGSQAV
jgi:hypothetical protein